MDFWWKPIKTQINSLETFFSHFANISSISNLIKELNVTDFKTNKSGIFYGKIIMFTGGLSKMSRAEAKTIIEKNSGKILSSVNKKLNYLIVGDKPTNKKVNQAKDYNIKIINQEEFNQLLTWIN